MEINLGDLPSGLAFHPSNSLLAVGLFSGHLNLCRYADDSTPEKLFKVRAHSESCREVVFVNEGSAIITGSSDCSILSTDVETGSAVARLDNAHRAAVYRIINLDESTIASGDEDGCIKVWDTRQRTCCNSFEVHTSYVSDMEYVSDSKRLLGTSGDGTLSVCNLRTNKVQTRSEFSEDEPISVVIMKNGKKVICGTLGGNLLLYSWGFFKDFSDRFVGSSRDNPVNALMKLDEDRVITGCFDGSISLVGILPNKMIQPIAEHNGSVERLAFSHDRKYLGSISYDDETLKLWDMDEILPEGPGFRLKRCSDVAVSDGTKEMDSKPSKGTKRKSSTTGNGLGDSTNFFADL